MGNNHSIFFDAVVRNEVRVVRQLLTSDPQLGTLTYQGFTGLGVAAQSGYNEIVELLLSFNADIEHGVVTTGSSPLILAVQENHSTTCSILLWRGANSNSVKKNGFTPLLAAIQDNYYDIVALLISHGADVDQANMKDGFTPLHVASGRGFSRIVTLLLQHGASVHAKDNRQFTPLIVASQEGHLDIVQQLVQRGADWNHRQSIGVAAIHLAAAKNHYKVVKCLVQAGCPVDLVSCNRTISSMLYFNIYRLMMVTRE